MAQREFTYKDFMEKLGKLLGINISKDRIYRWLRHPTNPLPATLLRVVEGSRGTWTADESELEKWAGSFERTPTAKKTQH